MHRGGLQIDRIKPTLPPLSDFPLWQGMNPPGLAGRAQPLEGKLLLLACLLFSISNVLSLPLTTMAVRRLSFLYKTVFSGPSSLPSSLEIPAWLFVTVVLFCVYSFGWVSKD